MQTTGAANRGDEHFDALAMAVRARAERFCGQPLFLVSLDAAPAPDAFELFRMSLKPEHRQPHNCSACRHFFAHYAPLVGITESGRLESVFWGNAADLPEEAREDYLDAWVGLKMHVERARVRDVFFAKRGPKDWGIPKTGEWRHFAVPAMSRPQAYSALHTAGQAMAEKHEEYAMLCRGLADFPRELVVKALTLLKTDTVYRSEKVIGVAEWLADLHEKIHAQKDRRIRENLIWRAVAIAPPGFCHVRSTMIGTLLDDLASGSSAEAAGKRFADKMHPLQYQRPQAPPSAGNIEQAEKVVEKLGIRLSLERRFARLSEIKTIWTPRAPATPPPMGGVFGHLRQPPDVIEDLSITKPIAR